MIKKIILVVIALSFFAVPAVIASVKKATLINNITGEKIVVNVGDKFPSSDWSLYVADKFGGRTDGGGDYSSLPSGSLSSVLSNATITSVATSALGSLATTTLYFKVTSLDKAGGQTLPGGQSTCSVGAYLTGAPRSCVVSISLNALASSTRLWIATTTNVYYGYVAATSSVMVNSLTLTAGTIPTSNTAYNDLGIARYNSFPSTLSGGQLSNLEVDVNGYLKTINGGYSFYATSSLGTVTIKSSQGVLHNVCINTPAANGVVTLYDNTSGAGTLIGTITLPATLLTDGPKCATYDAKFSTGLTYVNTGAALSMTFSYK